MTEGKRGVRNLFRIIFILIIVGALIAAGFYIYNSRIWGPGQPIPPQPDTPSDGTEVPPDEAGETGLRITLSDGNPEPETGKLLPVTVGIPLTDEEIQNILDRLPVLSPLAGDQVDFRLPEEVLPPPRAGDTIEVSFPPPPEAGPPDVDYGPLEVLRYSPEGEIPIAPFVNVTFNQPMAPLGTLQDLALEEVPVMVEPDLPGTWRWLGTKTLNFQYDSDLIDRMPMSTAYTITIPAGTESAVGGVLAEEIQFTFSTPTVTLQNHYPYSSEPQPLEPIMFASFNQRIEAEAVFEFTKVTANGEQIPIRLVTDEELAEDERVSQMVENANEGRWLAFKAKDPLPKASYISVAFDQGTPSAEGPLRTEFAQSFGFSTYYPLEIEEHGCSWWGDECPPLTPFFIEFNNPLDAEFYEDSMLKVEPEIPGVTFNIVGDTISIRGATEGRTTYRISVSGSIKDVFGQSLGRDQTLTFKVGPAEPFLLGPDSNFVTLDPASKRPVLSLYVMNYSRLDLQIYKVEPTDWNDFKMYLQDYQRTDLHIDPPGRLVRDEVLRLDNANDKLTEVGVDLSSVMNGNYGHFVVVVKSPTPLFQDERYWEHVNVWVQITQIGLDAFTDHSEMVVWATKLQDGTPLQDLEIRPDSGQRAGATDADGVVRFPIPGGGASYITAQRGDDVAMLPASVYMWDESGWVPRGSPDFLRWYVFDDRAMYKPGEEISVKGWIRLIGGKQDGDVGMVGESLTNISYQVIGPQGNEYGNGTAEVNALGGFDFKFTLPENANLGYANIQLNANIGYDGRYYSHGFQIQEFRRPEFEVTARNETTGPYFVGDSATVAVEAKYFAGGPLPNAETSWWVTSTPTNYNPPDWPEFTFGVWQPWWGWYEDGFGYNSGGDSQYFEGTTDASGTHYLNMDFASDGTMRPFSVMAEATVMDVNRQAWAGSTSLLVHPGDYYVGMRSERYFVERFQPLEIALIVTDLDGNPVPDREVKVTAARMVWKLENGHWGQHPAEEQECNLTSTQKPLNCEFETPVGGRYRITAIVTDELGRQNMSQFVRWVSGGDLRPSRDVEQERATLIPDKETYQPGDTAEILVQSPFSPAEGLLTVSRSGVLFTERFLIEEGSITLQIPIKSAHIPNLNVQVDLVGSTARTDDYGEPMPGIPDRPAFATGTLNLSIPPLQRTLELELDPRQTELEPGGRTTLDVTLTDAHGRPVPNAELAAVVVDEAILALTNYQLADPITVFYAHRPADVWGLYTRSSIILANPMDFETSGPTPLPTLTLDDEVYKEGEARAQVLAEADMMAVSEPAAAPMEMEEAVGLGGKAEEAPDEAVPITVRSDFNPLATFAPEVRTDARGKARVSIQLPDNLTRYRIMVVGVDNEGNQFGSAESNLTARLPLMVRPSAPRFLNFGDSFELPIVLQNQTEEELSVDVAFQAANINTLDVPGMRVRVPANDRVEVRFPVSTDSAGTARFQMAAVSDTFADAASIELPVYTPATTEAFATYGVVDEGSIVQPVRQPTDIFPQFGGLEVQTSSTALQALTDAVLYLMAYPYECSEQMSSRVLGVAALRDVLTAFEADGLPSASAMEAAVERDVTRLHRLQNYDGGFPYWRRGQQSIPFNTIHVAHALIRAELKGFEIPQDMKERARQYLVDIESHYPHWYSLRTRWTLTAYALYVRDLMNDNDPAKARQLLAEATLDGIPLEAVGWIWQVLIDDPNSGPELESIRRYIGNRVVETAGAANFTTIYDDQNYLILGSNRRADAVLLDALMADNPNSDLTPKLVNGLLAHRKKGRWGNTQENVFVLLALDRYFNTFEAQTPDFVARIWLGNTYVGDHAYEGRTTERRETIVPMSYLVDPSPGDLQDLVIQKDGVGRLYYRLGLKYAPTDLWLDPVDMGFVVLREYESVDNSEDVYRDNEGVWHIKAGARVRVRLSMVADNRRYHVALVDPLPAGLEIVNPALAVSGSVPQDPDSSDYRYGWWWWGTWYEHQNMRDERAEAFTSLLWDGVYNYTYIARATTPGTFVVPPAKAEEMYSPEVFGRSGSDWVIVE